MTFGTGTLRRGSTGSGVAELQQWLIDRGFLLAGTATGTYDEATEHAVKAFQLSAGIGVDGIVGAGTRTAAGAFSRTADLAGWQPQATRNIQVNASGGAFTTDTRRGILHTTQGARLPDYTNPPHFTVGRDGAGQPVSVWQHYPVTVASRALRHPSGTAQTNRHGAIQIEIIGDASDSPTMATSDPQLFTAVGVLMRWIERNAAVADIAHHPFDGEAAYGLSGSVRLSETEWLASNGWLGHQHVPNNTHWDPGAIDIAALLAVTAPAAAAPAAPSIPGSLSMSTAPPDGRRPSIRATTRRLSNAFPSLTFVIDTVGYPYFEVILTTDRSLFDPEQRARRTARNFYASRRDGIKEAGRAQGRYVAPVTVVREFAESRPAGAIYYTVIAYADPVGNGAVPAADPHALARSAPAVQMVPGFRGHTLTEALGVPLGMLKPSHRMARRHGRSAGASLSATPGNTPVAPPVPRTIDPATDRADGEDGYDYRLSTQSSVPDSPIDLQLHVAREPRGAPTHAEQSPPQPPISDSTDRHDVGEAGDGTNGVGRDAVHAADTHRGDTHAANGAGDGAAASYDDGWGSWESASALDSTFPRGQAQPPPLVGAESPDLGYDDELDDLGWAGAAYADAPEGTAARSPQAAPPSASVPANGRPAPPSVPHTDWRPPVVELTAADKRDIIEAFVGTDKDLYSLTGRDDEFAGRAGADHPAYQRYHLGLSFGIVRFSQDSGELGQLLTLMHQRGPDRFVAVFGDATDELLRVTNLPGPRSRDMPDGRSVRVQPVAGADLWDEPWLSRFNEAGSDRVLQGAQIELASALYLDPVLRFASDLGLASQRGLAMIFDRTAHRGVTGGLTWVIETVGPLQTPVLRQTALEALGFPDVESLQRSQPDLLVDDNFGPLTHAALTAALRHHLAVAGTSPVPLLTDRQMLEALAQRAAGHDWADRFIRLSRDTNLSDVTISASPVR